VDDEITATQEVNRLRSEKIMRIRNEADANRGAQMPSTASHVEVACILARLENRC